MLKIGITGGIGSGKTTICKIFELLGIPVYYADDRAKMLMVEDEGLRHQVIGIFGPEAYFENGSLNRSFIAREAFGDHQKLKKLNAAVHPAVWTDGETWNKKQEAAGVPYCMKEAALIFESGGDKFLDKIIVVYAPEELRIQRVVDRDKVAAGQVRDRMKKQLPDEDKLQRADFVIYNDGKQMLIPQVVKIHRHLLKLAKHK